MLSRITIQEAASKLRSILERVKNGQEVLLYDDEHLVAKIVPAHQRSERRRILGALKGKIWIADDFDEPLEDFVEYS